MTGLCDAVHIKSHKGIQGRGDILLCKHDPCQMSVTPTCIVFGLHAFLRLFYSIYIYIHISYSTRRCSVTHIFIIKICHLFCIAVNWTLGNIFQWNFSHYTEIVIQDNSFHYIFCKGHFVSALMCQIVIYTGKAQMDVNVKNQRKRINIKECHWILRLP